MADTSQSPVVLIHGAWHGGWCWQQVADDLANDGFDVIVVSLPDHGDPGNRSRSWARISGYLESIAEAVTSCDRPPVLVGHSMGGYLVQRFLENNTAAAGVLVASVPRRGAFVTNLRLLRKHPIPTLKSAITADYSGLIASRELVRSLFFRPATPAEVVESTFTRLQNESALAISTMIIRPPRPKRVTTPVHVIAASDDAIFTLEEQQDLAAAYRTELKTVPESGHDIMVDTNWKTLSKLVAQIAASA